MLRARHVPVEREGYGGCGPTKRARLVEGGGVDQKGVGQSSDSRRSPTSLESRLGPLPSKGRVLGAPRRIAGAGLLPRGNSSGSRPVTCTDCSDAADGVSSSAGSRPKPVASDRLGGRTTQRTSAERPSGSGSVKPR